MPLVEIKLPPGIYGQGTQYQSKSRWLTAQLMRFTEGVIKPLGGWVAVTMTGVAISGTARALLGWLYQGVLSPMLAVGTNTKIYTFTAGAITDRTPPDLTTGGVDTVLSVGAYGVSTYGSQLYGAGDTSQSTVTPAATWQLDTFGSYPVGVLSSDGRLLYWDGSAEFFVPITGARALGTLTVTVIPSDTETVLLNGKTYTFQTTLTNVDGHVLIGATLATALANLTAAVNLGTGAGTLYAAATTLHPTMYARNTSGTVVKVYAKAWGTGGNALTTTETLANGAFGGVTLASGAAETSPTSNTACVVTNERFLVALGAGGDPRSLAWASQESLTDWVPSSLNTAEDARPIPGVGKLVCGRRTKGETLIWTTDGLFAMRYIGGTLVYSVEEVGAKCGIVGPNACAVMDSRAVWMGPKGFFVYDGFVQPVTSDVSYVVFSDLNVDQKVKCFARLHSELSEVHFHYPSSSSQECDKYVIWNYRENHWTPGSLTRSAGIDRGAFDYPLYVTGSTVYYHELGTDHSGATAPSLASGPFEIGEGDRVMMITEIIPDEATVAGQTLGSTTMTIYGALYPTATETTNGPYTMANPTSARVTARQIRVKISESVSGAWVVGTPRLNVLAGGLR